MKHIKHNDAGSSVL